MNDTFDVKRFSLLLKKSILERQALLLGLLSVTLTITLLTYAIVQSMAGITKGQLSAFVIGFLLGGSFIASSVFGYFSSNSSGSSFLMLPASHFEKWTCGILIAGVLFTSIYLGFYRLIDILFVNNYHNNLDVNNPNYQTLFNAVEVFPFSNAIAKMIYVLFVNISGAMLVGSLFYNKVSYIKTALIVCAIVIGSYFLNLLVAHLFFNNIDMAVPFRNNFLRVDKEIGIIDLPPFALKLFNIFITYIIPCTLWLTAYVRLKEKEI